MNRLLIVFVLVCCFYSCSSQQTESSNLQKLVKAFVTDSCFKAAGIGIVISDTSTGEILAKHNGQMVLTPASSQKLMTTAAALEILGSDYQFKTSIVSNGKIENGFLKGDLIVKGFGDPTLNSKYFKNRSDFCSLIIEKLKELRIHTISGKVLFDESYFSSSIPATWIWEDIGNYYGTVPHAINYSDNMYTLHFESGNVGSLTSIQRIIPKNTGLEFENKVISSDINRDLAYIFGGNTSTKRRIEGSIPKNRKNFAVKGAMMQPSVALRNDLLNDFQQANITLLNKNTNTTEEQELFALNSPYLSDIVAKTNLESINLFADQLLFEIAQVQNGKANWKFGVQAIKDFWKRKGISTSYQKLYDGSGLSHFNAISAAFFNRVLIYMYQSNLRKVFLSSLPVAGKSGTLKYFGKGSELEANWIAKTGSMTGVRSYCGYLKTSKKKTYAISILINNYNCSSKDLNNKILNLLIHVYNP